MEVLVLDDGVLLNREVLDLMQERKNNRIHEIGKSTDYADTHWLEHKVIMYLSKLYPNGGNDTVGRQLKSLLLELEQGGFQGKFKPNEICQIMNIVPKQAVDVHMILDDCENRFTDDMVDQILDIIQRTIIDASK